ncbi:MAG: alpha/beta hydrolase-fold protein [Acidobacteriota bacterium]|nr:alpha/beta hydrolase-fold protein [Acidobacteriota bacterium]
MNIEPLRLALPLAFTALLLVPAARVEAQEKIRVSTVETHDIEAKAVDQTYRVHVAVPPRSQSSTDRYGVLYVTDMSAPIHAIADAIHLMGFAREIPPMIVVGVGYPVDSIVQTLAVRSRDLTPVEDLQLSAQRAMSSGIEGALETGSLSGGADDFLRFFHEELFPFVDGRYPTTAERSYFGDSLGGLFGLYALFERPETFSRYIIGSPSIWVGKEWLLDRAKQYTEEYDDLAARVFVAVGGNEEVGAAGAPFRMVTNVGRLETILAQAELPSLRLSTHIFPDESHLSVVYMNLFRGLHKVHDPVTGQ